MKRDLDLFVFSDALGWELAERFAFGKGWLAHRKPCRTLLGYSCTCDPSILTGLYPDEHGHFSFYIKAAPGTSPFTGLRRFAWLPHRIAGHHRVRNRVSRWIASKNHYTGYFQLYSVPFRFLPYMDYTEKKDIYEPGGILGGQGTFFDDWRASGLNWMRSDWRLGDAVNLDSLEAAVEKGEVELAYLFTAGLDALMHREGISGEAVEAGFAAFEKRLKQIFERAQERYNKVRLYLFSDHGMTQVEESSDLMKRWEALGYTFGKDYVAAWDSTMARFWFEDDTVRSAAQAWLAEQKEGRILEAEELKRERCFFGDSRYGELFYLMDPGKLLVPSFMNLGFVTGMHGYTPEDKDSTAALLSTEPCNHIEHLPELSGLMRSASQR